jgi:hypothetical protein
VENAGEEDEVALQSGKPTTIAMTPHRPQLRTARTSRHHQRTTARIVEQTAAPSSPWLREDEAGLVTAMAENRQ